MSQDVEENIIDFANQVFSLSGLDLVATGERNEDSFRVQVSGEDVAILLGHRAELLDALEYLANRAVNRDADLNGRIVFDSGNYRAQREKELQLMAEKAAEKVRGSRIPFSFDPMSPNERRIIHLALVDDRTVKTESQGDGIDRKVTIFPA